MAKHSHEVLATYDQQDIINFTVEIIKPEVRCQTCIHSEGNGESLECYNPKNYEEWPVEAWQLEPVDASDCCENHESQNQGGES